MEMNDINNCVSSPTTSIASSSSKFNTNVQHLPNDQQNTLSRNRTSTKSASCYPKTSSTSSNSKSSKSLPNGNSAGASNGPIPGRPSVGEPKIGIYESIEAQLSHLGKRKTWLGIILGQICSGFLCLSAITNVYLIDVYSVRLPNAQNFAFYLLLSLVFTSLLAFRRGERNLFPVLRLRGWKYALVALADVEGSFLMVKAYQFTTITSVQLLDCFTIPTVLSFSWLILRIRFRVPHILGVSICLLGISCLVWADIESDGRFTGTGKDRFIGDMFCLSGAFLYGISGVAQEFIVKTFDVIEFLGMIGLVGSFISGIQTIVLEYSTVADSNWNSQVIILITAYGFGQLTLHCLCACVIKLSSITALCLSLLSADFYVVMLGIQLFQYKFHPLYFLSFIFVMCGVIIFALKPTTTMPHLYRSLVREQMTITTDLELLASSNSTHSMTTASGATPITSTTTVTVPGRILHHNHHHPFDNNYGPCIGDQQQKQQLCSNNVSHFADICSSSPQTPSSPGAAAAASTVSMTKVSAICEMRSPIQQQQQDIPTPNHSSNKITTSSLSSNSSSSCTTCSNNSRVEMKQHHVSPLNHQQLIEKQNNANGGPVTSFTYAIPEDEIC